MPFRARMISEGGGFGAAAKIAGLELTGITQVYLGKVDRELGFGVPPKELLEANNVVVETLAGQPWPGAHVDLTGLDAGKAAMLHSYRAGAWPTEDELVLQANITAKLDPKTRPAILRQHYLRQGMSPAEADKAVERDKVPHQRQGLLDGVSAIESRQRPARGVPADSTRVDDDEREDDEREDETSTRQATPAEAQARREAEARSGSDDETSPSTSATPARSSRTPAPKSTRARSGTNSKTGGARGRGK